MLLLLDDSGRSYPNESHISGQTNKFDYLILKKPMYLDNGNKPKFYSVLSVAGCNKDIGQGQCTETVSFGFFKPDWTLIDEVKDLKISYRSDIHTWEKSKGSDAIILTQNLEQKDIPGQYHIFAIIYRNNTPVLELSQIFWIQE